MRRVASTGTEHSDRRLGAAFRRRFMLRHHMALLMAMVIGFGMFANYLMRKLGLISMPLRYGIGVCCAYAAFFPIVSCWLEYIRQELELDLAWRLQAGTAAGGEPDAVAAGTGAAPREPSAAWDVVGHGAVESLGCLVETGELAILAVAAAAVIALVATVVGGGVWLFVEAPAILTEAAFETLLALSLIKSVKRLETPGWPISIWRSTWGVFAGVLGLAMVTGWLLQWFYPGATTLGEVLKLRLGR